MTKFFYMNSLNNEIGEEACNTTYQDFPQYFVWHKTSKTWTKRQKGFSLGQMYFVPPTGGERFYLRTLLTVVRGSKSFNDLRTFERVEHSTFQDCCRSHGLLEDNREWRICLSEASVIQTGSVTSCCPGCGYSRSGDELGNRERLRAPMFQGTHSKWGYKPDSNPGEAGSKAHNTHN